MMNDVLSRLLRIDPQSVLVDWSVRFRLGWPLPVLAALVAVAALAAALMYRREAALGRFARIALAIARAAAAALLLTALFQPAVEARIRTPLRPVILVLADDSASMDIRDTRKDAASLAEAAMVLGKLPYDAPEVPRSAAAAARAMDAAASALEAAPIEAARDSQERLAQAMEELLAVTRKQPPLNADLSAGLAALAERQAGLRRKLAADDADAISLVAPQRDLAAELDTWREQARNAGLTISDKLKAELALISRRELVDAALAGTLRPLLERLGGRAQVRFFDFASTVKESAEPWRGPTSLPAVDRSATALGGALLEAVEASQGPPIALAVVLTDGAHNAGVDAMEAAWRLRRLGVPLVTVGVGLPRPDDASLRNLLVADMVFANDIVPLRVQCRASGYEKRSTTLLVKVDGAEVARRQVTFAGDARFVEAPFKAPRMGGPHTLEVLLVGLPGEATEANNVIRRPLRVLDDKIKVLYVEGTPRWEHRYIRAVLKRDPRIDVQFINTEGDKDLARASREHLGRFPETEAQAFRYDLVILGDVRANTFTPTQLSLLEQLVRERGGSLILLAGRKHAPAEYVDTPLAAMLPVRFGADAWEDIGDDVHPVLTSEGRRSTVMAMERSEARTQALWANVRPLNWVPPVLGAKPAAVVLAELSDSSQRLKAFPLIAWHRYGAGKCMFVGTDQLWRLRARTGDKYHLRFWGQAVQFLTLSRLLGENRRVRLQTGRDEYPLGEPVEVFAAVLNDLYEPLSSPRFEVGVAPAGEEEVSNPVTSGEVSNPVTSGLEPRLEPQQGAAGTTVLLKALPGAAGMYHGLYSPASPGRYRVTASADADGRGRSAGAVAAEFDVRSETSEKTETGMRRDLLVKMARTTGGEYLSLRDLPLLGDWVRDRRASMVYVKEYELWDNWLVALVFVSLVGLEWAWRRSRNLA